MGGTNVLGQVWNTGVDPAGGAKLGKTLKVTSFRARPPQKPKKRLISLCLSRQVEAFEIN